MKKIAFKTLGCRLNLYETDALASKLAGANYQVVNFNQKADIYVINTCTVTNQSDQKSRQAISQSNRINPDGLTIVTGCMATNYKKDLEGNDTIDYVVDNNHKTSIPCLLDAHFKGETVSPDQFESNVFNFAAADETFHTRSFIKVQDGCDNFCTFCIVPKVRGRAVSRPPKDIFENIRQVVAFGFKEVVITGVNIGRYQSGEYDFEKLVKSILEIPGDFKVRISSIEPDGFRDSFFKLFKHPKLTPHLHLCLQSGSEDILLQMRRMYSASEFEKVALKLKSDYPNFNLTTDIIVGFPGETAEDFQQTIDITNKIGFGHAHTFKYSVRSGTRAEMLPDQIPEKVKTNRSEIIRKLVDENKLAYRKSFIGQNQRVLIEKINKGGFASGYGENYVPVIIHQKGLEKNTFCDVVIESVQSGEEPILIGKIKQPPA